MRKIPGFLLIVSLLMSVQALKGQNSKTLPSDPGEFIEAYASRLSKFGTKEVQQYAKAFQEKWIGGAFQARQQERFINHVNLMLLKNYSLDPEILQYSQTFEALINPETFGQIREDEFYTVTDSCILQLDRKKTIKFFRSVRQFLESGTAFKTTTASWGFSQDNPALDFTIVRTDGRTHRFPRFTFTSTDLIFRGPKDSTYIYNTKGTLNLMNKVWLANGGRIDWAKMKLEPTDVYCTVDEYMLNLNYSFVKIDTVTFFYNSLIGRPLKGKYEDVNKGYRNINKANYPYFRSYEGGVVIENFIPNVRYEGGFSLRGIRRIGSAYYKYVDQEGELKPIYDIPVKKEEPVEEPEEDPEEDPYGDDWDWEDTYDDSKAFFLDDDEVIDDEDAWEEPDGDVESDDETGGGDFEDIVEEADEIDSLLSGKVLKLVKAQLTIDKDGKPGMKLKANEFVLDLEKLVSKRCEVAVFVSEEDSITHPSVDVLYLVDSNEVVLTKDKKDKFARQPFLSPYHNFFLYFDALRWKVNSDKIEFTFLIDKENEVAAIESKDFFQLGRWRQFRNMVNFHPIGAIYRYFLKEHPGEMITTAEAIVDMYNEPDQLPALLFALIDMEGSGFIDYDPKTHEIRPKEKLFDWAMAARKRKDYDAIQIISQVKSGNNAEVDRATKEMKMSGVKFFSLSDSQFVRVLPYKEEVEISKNRNLEFGGVVAAGKLNFYGLGQDMFKYEYDNHKILCDSLDSLRFILVRNPPLGFVFSPLQKALRNTSIEGVTGAIYINKPNNKNGLDVYPEYPVFDSYTNSYVYWAKPNIHGGVYGKEKLYFSIDPFVLDSLEDFDERKLSFEGEFYSSEIFPRFRQRLTVMKDYTLGLEQIVPDTGYPVYDGKGRFTNGSVILDGSGLRSDGQIDFLETTAKSDSFEMYFDSVKAVTQEFFMPGGERDGAYFPEIKAKEVKYKWLTKQDQIELESVSGEPIVMFEGEGTFEGKLVITPEGLKGSGTLTMNNVSVTSDEIIFNEKDFKARESQFRVADKNNPGKELFLASNVNVDYDISAHHSEFEADVDGKTNMSFTQQKWKTSLAKGTYDRKSNDVTLESRSSKIGKDIFISTDPKQDSLRFNGREAHYNFDEQMIEIEEVPYIYVADAKITPDSGKVNVKPDGFLQKLENTVIEANLETKYHRMYDSDVEIKSAYNYTGSGKYDYIAINGQDQYIELSEINVRKDTTTVAKGDIPEEQNFYLTDRIFFKGETYLTASDKYMRFNGEVKIESDIEIFAESWFPFENVTVNPDSVFIPVKEAQLGNLTVGLHYIPRYRVFYSTFLQPLKDKTDKTVVSAAGTESGLTFDRIRQEFRIGPKAKLTGLQYSGTTSSFNDSTNLIITQGMFEFPFNFARNTIDVQFAGSWRDDMQNKEISTDIMASFDFSVIPKEAWAKLGTKFETEMPLAEDINFLDRTLMESMAEYLDPKGGEEKRTKEFVQEAQNAANYLDVKVAKELPVSLLLSGIRFRYDPEYKSLYASGEVGIVGINGKPINKMTNNNTKIEYNIGKISPTNVRYSDTLNIYLETDNDTWVYFKFVGQELLVASSAEDFTGELAAAIEKRKKNDGYRFNLTDEDEAGYFKGRFANRYIFKRDP